LRPQKLTLEEAVKNTINYRKENNEFMNKSLSADLIVSIHFVIVIFNVGGLLVIILGGILRWRFVRNFWFRAIHLGMVVYSSPLSVETRGN
jgi:hypothetical protein